MKKITLLFLPFIAYSQLPDLPAYKWGGNIGGTGYDHGFGVTVDNLDRMYVTDSFRTPADFDLRMNSL